MPEKPGKSSPVASVRELARLVGRNHSSVLRWLKHPEWPFGMPPWPRGDVRRIVRWADKHLTRGDPATRQARIALLEEQLHRLEFDLALASGELLPRADAEDVAASAIASFRRGLADLVFCLRDDIASRPAAEIEPFLASHLSRLALQYEQQAKQIESIRSASPVQDGRGNGSATATED